LGRAQRLNQKYAEAKTAVERAQALAPKNNIASLERVMLARATNDLAGERAVLTELLAREPQRAAPLRAELESVLLRQGDIDVARKEGALCGPLPDAVAMALEGKREPAARALVAIA